MSDQNRAILRKIPLFRDFDDAACDATLSVLRIRQFHTGDQVFRQGEQGDTMVIVVAGHLRVELDDGHTAPTTIGAITAGEIVGEMACLDPAPRATSVVAVAETTVFELSRGRMQELRMVSPAASAAIVAAVINDVTRRLRQANDRIDRVLNPKASGVHRPVDALVRPVEPFRHAEPEPAPAEHGSVFSRIWARLSGD